MNKLKKIVTSFRYYGRIKKGLTREQCNILADIYALLISPSVPSGYRTQTPRQFLMY